MTAVRALLIAIVLTCTSDMASAHSLNLFVHDNSGGTITGNAYFTGGTPAQNLTVRVEDNNGALLGEAKTDDKGDFTYTGARVVGKMKFIVATADGHRAEATIDSGTGTQPHEQGGAALALAVVNASETDIAELHQAIDKLTTKLWIRDVIGGIGYIFGLAGLWALWKARSRSDGH